MIMGGVYLTYSAYFLSLDFSTIYTIMNVIMVLLYSGIGITYAKNCRDNIKRVQANLLIMRDNDENIMRDSLLIKKTMLRYILLGTTLFCTTKALDYGIACNLKD